MNRCSVISARIVMAFSLLALCYSSDALSQPTAPPDNPDAAKKAAPPDAQPPDAQPPTPPTPPDATGANGGQTPPDGTPTGPDGKQPDGTPPDGTQPDGTPPDSAKTPPDSTTGTPDGTKPDGTKPDGTKPDATKPDATKPDATKPDGAKPDGAKPDEPSVAVGEEEEGVELEGDEVIVIVGSRRAVRSKLDTVTAVDVLSVGDLESQGVSDMGDMLKTMVPGFNLNEQPISDAATLIRPANLRGLPPDMTVVLVNGKRRHRGAVIAFLGGGVSDGAQGVDTSVIPSIALAQVEVLRDGAAAQYGADAIAGVMNFVLRKKPRRRALSGPVRLDLRGRRRRLEAGRKLGATAHRQGLSEPQRRV